MKIIAVFLLLLFSSLPALNLNSQDTPPYDNSLKKGEYIYAEIERMAPISTPFDSEILTLEIEANIGSQQWLVYTPDYDRDYRLAVQNAEYIRVPLDQLKYVEEAIAKKSSEGKMTNFIFLNLKIDFFDGAGTHLQPPSKGKLSVLIYF